MEPTISIAIFFDHSKEFILTKIDKSINYHETLI